MHALPLPLALAAFTLVLGAWLHYLSRIGREKVPVRPLGHLAVFAGASGLALAAAGLGLWAGVGALPPIVAAVALGLAWFFVYLLRQAPMPDGELVVAPGDALPLIEAIGSDGAVHRSSDQRGERLLFKVFRGQW